MMLPTLPLARYMGVVHDTQLTQFIITLLCSSSFLLFLFQYKLDTYLGGQRNAPNFLCNQFQITEIFIPQHFFVLTQFDEMLSIEENKKV